jgi:hypothetical protein
MFFAKGRVVDYPCYTRGKTLGGKLRTRVLTMNSDSTTSSPYLEMNLKMLQEHCSCHGGLCDELSLVSFQIFFLHTWFGSPSAAISM